MTDTTVPLTALAEGEGGTVVALYPPCAMARLAALGFTPGVQVQMIRNAGRGPLIVSLLDTEVALGRGQAAHIAIRRAAP